jgi:NTE family protein
MNRYKMLCLIVVEKNDSSRQKITPKHILATSASSDNFPWVELEEGVYAWDGALLNNTPFSEVIDASPVIQAPVCLIRTISSDKVSLGRN